MKKRPNLIICPYKKTSKGAKYLQQALQNLSGTTVPFVDLDYAAKDHEWILLWGAGYYRNNYSETVKDLRSIRIWNPPRALAVSINKITFFKHLKGTDVNIPKWTTSYAQALKWVADGCKVVSRGIVEGRDGQGITVTSNKNELQEAPLYTIFKPSTQEFRVHMFNGTPLISLLRKKCETVNSSLENVIRVGSNGWRFFRDCPTPNAVVQEAQRVMKHLPLDYCAVDLIYNKASGETTVIEINSAPELGPWTSKAYAKHILNLRNSNE